MCALSSSYEYVNIFHSAYFQNKNDSRFNKRQCIPLKLNCAYKYNIKSICPQGLQVAHVYSLYSKPIFILLLPRIYILRVFWCSRGFKPLEMLNICISAKSNKIRLLFEFQGHTNLRLFIYSTFQYEILLNI